MDALNPWSDKWTPIKPLGGGGQGDTMLVKAVSGEIDQAVLKLLKPHKKHDAKARGRMAQEVTNLKVLRNAGGKVPQVLDSNTELFEDQSVPLYFVMEYMDGKTLAEAIQGSGGLPLDAAIGVALDLCSTMRVANEAGIAHRDIKPENMIVRSLTPADIVMVDFGLSFNEDESLNLTETEETLDNKFISLPERRGPGENKRDFRSDLTGICAILFYCLTECAPRNLRDSQGRPPHQWPNYSLSKRIQDETQRNAMNLLLNKGLNYEIEFRFQTIGELVTRLEEILKPTSTEIVEDLDAVLVRESAALRKTDRKTQLAEYTRNAQALNQSFNLCWNEIETKLRNYPSFELGQYGMSIPFKENSDDGDTITCASCWVRVRNHELGLKVQHRFVAHGLECTVYRELLEGPFPQGSLAMPTTTALISKVVVTRYRGDTMPNAPLIIADMKAAVSKAIALISEKIQGNR